MARQALQMRLQLFMQTSVYWAFAIHLEKLKEARFTIIPNNNELQDFSSFRHANYILPPLGVTGLITHGAVGAIGQSANLDHEVFPSISKMIRMALAVKNDIQGDYLESFKAFYNRKTMAMQT